MSENSIEILDLSALDKIESIQCCRNQIKELTINGRVLNSLVASNNSKIIKNLIHHAFNMNLFYDLRFISIDCEAAAKEFTTC